eukprot:s923_g15.t1
MAQLSSSALAEKRSFLVLSRALPRLAGLIPGVSGQHAPGYQDLCQEVGAFATSVCRPDRVLRLLPLPGQALQWLKAFENAQDPAVMSELQNLSCSAMGFVQRLTSRFPLHADLAGPVVLAAQALLHGLQMLYRQLWQTHSASALEASGAGICSTPQSPAHEPGGIQVALGPEADSALGNPEVACWWLRWTALSFSSPTLAAPKPKAALGMLRKLSILHQEDENERAKEDIDAMTLFKMAKAKAEKDAAENEDDATEKALFPGEDQAEAYALLGLNEDGTNDADGDGEVIGGSSLYDMWATSKAASTKKKGEQNQGNSSRFHLQPQQISDLCELSLECFGSTTPTNFSKEADDLRLDALDASLEMFIRLCVCGLTNDKITSTLLPADVAFRISPMVLLRLHRTAKQLQPGPQRLTDADSIGKKRTAAEARKSLHSSAACAFYSESSPAILLQLAAPLSALLARVRELLDQFEEHPSLLAIEGLVEKMMGLNLLQTTPMTVVTMLELLLGRATVWEEAAARHVSLQAQIQPLKALVVSLRERQLLEWKGLRQIREQHWERHGAKWWLHLIGLLSEDMDARSLVDELLKFVRTSPLGEFRLRLQMLHAAARLHLEAEDSSSSGLVAHHVWHFSRRWLPAVEKELVKTQQAMEKEIQDLVKIVRWDLSNYHALKDSVSRSHRQLSRAIKRFDDNLQELVDMVLSRATVEGGRENHEAQGRILEAANFTLSSGEMRVPEASGQSARMNDSEEFWADSGLIAAALPSMLSSFVRMVGQQLLPDAFCLAAPQGSGLHEVAEDLCSEVGSVLESLQDQESALPVKRRRLQGMKEICSSFGFVPRPVHDDSFDVADFFSLPLPELRQAPPTHSESKKQIDPEPPRKRARTKKQTKQSAPATSEQAEKAPDVAATFKQQVDSAWARTDSIMYHILHLALRLHSTKTRPRDLTAGEMQVWLGLASASIQAVRCHRERCLVFQNAVVKLADVYGATLADRSLKVQRAILLSTFSQLDRMLEGTIQARLIANAASPSTELENWQGVATSFSSVVTFVRESDDFQSLVPQADPEGSSVEHVRVKANFLERLISQIRLSCIAPSNATIMAR